MKFSIRVNIFHTTESKLIDAKRNKMHSTVFQRTILEEALMETGVKLGLSEKDTKFEKIFLVVLTNQLIYLVNVIAMRIFFFSNYVCF